MGEPSDLPSGVRLVPEPAEEEAGPSGTSPEDPWAGEGLPVGEGGLLPWREYARGGQGLREREKPKEASGRTGGKGKLVTGGKGK